MLFQVCCKTGVIDSPNHSSLIQNKELKGLFLPILFEIQTSVLLFLSSVPGLWCSRMQSDRRGISGLWSLFTIYCRGTRAGIWCLCVIVLEPSHMLSPVCLLSLLLICAVCLQISDILLRLRSGVPALPSQRERDPHCVPLRSKPYF